MAVKIVRFLGGEEILGDVVKVDDKTLKINNPTQISASANPKTGKVDVAMAPFAPLSSQTHIEVNTDHVLTQYEPVVDILNKYNTLFGSGIVLPNMGLGAPGILQS